MPLNEGATSEILPFCTEGTIADGDLLSLEDYATFTQRLRGHQKGMALRELHNRALRQVSLIAAGLAQYIANRFPNGVVDNGDLDAIEAGIVAAIRTQAPDASEDAKGLVELATVNEAKTGTDTVRAVTPAGLKAALGEITVPNASEEVVGIARFASPAEVLARSNPALVISPANIGLVAANPGDLVVTARRIPPPGTVKANGAAVAIASYEDLAAAIYCGDTRNALAPWGYRCTNPATPSTTRSIAGTHIVLPDLRGEGLRGWDDGRGVDVQVMTGTTTTGSAAITAVADTQTLYVGQSITGTGIPAGATIAAITNSTAITISSAATATATGVSLTFVGRAFGSWQGDAIRNITGALSPTHASSVGGTATGAIGKISGAGDTGTSNQGEARLGFDFDASRVVPTAPENRVRNVALLICIKY